MSWTHFHDMHSGGGRKLAWGHIFIEAPVAEAKRVFAAMFGRNPDRVTCTCCGEDYSTSEYPSLREASARGRGCGHDDKTKSWVEDGGDRKLSFHEYRTLDARLAEEARSATPSVKVVYEAEIPPGARDHEVTAEGYVWVGAES